MATRFYLPSSGAAAVTPTLDGTWNGVNSVDRLRMVTTKSATAIATSSAPGIDITGAEICLLQYVSDPLEGAQTINGTIESRLYCWKLAAGNAWPFYIIRVFSGNGVTSRGTLWATTTKAPPTSMPASEAAVVLRSFATTATGDTVTEVAASDGDRIVIEIGADSTTAIASVGETVNIIHGDNQATDAPEDETDTSSTTKNGWIEFSQTLTFEGGYTHSGWGVAI